MQEKLHIGVPVISLEEHTPFAIDDSQSVLLPADSFVPEIDVRDIVKPKTVQVGPPYQRAGD